MANQNATALEKTKADFSVEKMLEIRAKAQEAVELIASQVQVGACWRRMPTNWWSTP
jgi:hypothetical protein